MPVNATAGSTLPDEEVHRIIMEREQECFQLQAMNSTPPPGTIFQYILDTYINLTRILEIFAYTEQNNQIIRLYIYIRIGYYSQIG